MASIQLTVTASEELAHLLESRELPATARGRVIRRLRQLEQFPESGKPVSAIPWGEARALTGPWWFVFVYLYDPVAGTLIVTTIQDARTATGARAASDR